MLVFLVLIRKRINTRLEEKKTIAEGLDCTFDQIQCDDPVSSRISNITDWTATGACERTDKVSGDIIFFFSSITSL